MAKNRLIKKIHYHYKKKNKDIDIDLDVDLSRFNKQYGKAQFQLDSAIMTSMVPFMPMDTHTFINVTRGLSAAIAGSGHVYAAAPPFGRFLYEGKVMVDSETGSPYARPAAEKVLVSQYTGKTAAKENIEYNKSAHPKVTDHWFDAAKKADGAVWIRNAKHTAGGG